MPTQLHSRPLLLLTVILCCTLSLCAQEFDSLTTRAGKIFQSVKILKLEADGITIMHRDGGCRILVEDLPPNIQKQLGISDNEAAQTLRAQRSQTQKHLAEKQRQAHELAARKKQRAMIAKLVAQQEWEYSKEAKVTVLKKHEKGYICQAVHPVLVDVTKQVTTTLGGKKTIVVGKKRIFPDHKLSPKIFLLSEKRLSPGRAYELRILHEEPYVYSHPDGTTQHIEQYRSITEKP
ncbi:hypothetical protein [Rubritalea tangerina]|uniref:Uncharacterized protein n=1 Tax=Rubritalea tangerina TaxID=430798 RepID=A0ABW4Z723_9BACT